MAFEAEITEIFEAVHAHCGSIWQVGLSRTEFRAGDSGVLRASSRSGTQLEVPVLNVETDASGTVWHFVRKPLAAGTHVRGEVSPRN
jgi:hypothetical protein